MSAMKNVGMSSYVGHPLHHSWSIFGSVAGNSRGRSLFWGVEEVSSFGSLLQIYNWKKKQTKIASKMRIFRTKKGMQIKTSKSKRSPFWGCCGGGLCPVVLYCVQHKHCMHNVQRGVVRRSSSLSWCGAVPRTAVCGAAQRSVVHWSAAPAHHPLGTSTHPHINHTIYVSPRGNHHSPLGITPLPLSRR